MIFRHSNDKIPSGPFTGKTVRKRAAGILSLLMLSVVLFSAFFIAAEAGHDCTEEDCPICACVQLCENTLHHMSDGETAQFVAVVPVLIFLFSAPLTVCVLPRETPVTNKVRLNN